MCSIALALTIGSTLLGAAGQIQQANAQAAAANYNAKVQDMNAQIAERRAKDSQERGVKEEQQKRVEVQKILGAQKVAMAANGVDLSFGSPLDVAVDSAALGELDALTIRTNSAREAYDHRVDAENQRAGANLSRMEGRAAKKAGYLAAFGTVLTGAGKAWQGYQQYGGSSIGSIA